MFHHIYRIATTTTNGAFGILALEETYEITKEKANLLLTELVPPQPTERNCKVMIALLRTTLVTHFATKSFRYCGLVISLFGLFVSSLLVPMVAFGSFSYIATSFSSDIGSVFASCCFMSLVITGGVFSPWLESLLK